VTPGLWDARLRLLNRNANQGKKRETGDYEMMESLAGLTGLRCWDEAFKFS
jgi:hypothetical protein